MIAQATSALPLALDTLESFEGFHRDGTQDLLRLVAEAGGTSVDPSSGQARTSSGPGCAAQMAAFFRGLSERVDLASFEIRDFVAQGAEVLSFGSFSGRLRAGQGAVASDWAIRWRVESGRLRMAKAFVDTPGM